ncbi:RNA polymerase sigma factor [Altericroceibacterium spongiae]|uniref:RNA polymerase sigma factor n=1 Tax=Altericroceibacterium spongiae TaxID=2320269 RepID=A0A420EQZ1_9SPHN|nr:RNA polymerase sigma factor [Altericroceibacterium spongiae]RKF23095.1 RNA polymerase sigma factor [Altericroceibacterium spongiae]
MVKRAAKTSSWTNFNTDRLCGLRTRLTAYFRRSGYDPFDAEDLTQDVFLKMTNVVAVREQLQDGYVFTIARNLQRDERRRARVRLRYDSSVESDGDLLTSGGSDAPDAERVLIGKEEAGLLIDGLSELPERTRRIFLLYRLEGYAQRDIAQKLGISVSAVEKNVARAMLHLLKKVDREK